MVFQKIQNQTPWNPYFLNKKVNNLQAKVPSASCGVARAGSVTATRREAARNGRPNVLRKPGWQREMSDTLAAWIFGCFFSLRKKNGMTEDWYTQQKNMLG